jgi:hypothetical protein
MPSATVPLKPQCQLQAAQDNADSIQNSCNSNTLAKVMKDVLQKINTYHSNPHNIHGPGQNPNSEGTHHQVDGINQSPNQNENLDSHSQCCDTCE